MNAVLLMMKRKFSKGDEIFVELLKEESIELNYLVNIYRAYGLILLKKY